MPFQSRVFANRPNYFDCFGRSFRSIFHETTRLTSNIQHHSGIKSNIKLQCLNLCLFVSIQPLLAVPAGHSSVLFSPDEIHLDRTRIRMLGLWLRPYVVPFRHKNCTKSTFRINLLFTSETLKRFVLLDDMSKQVGL